MFMMLKKILHIFFISLSFFLLSKETTMNDHEPIHVFAALKFPLNAVRDSFTLTIFKQIDETFGNKGIGLDSYQIEHIKKTYLYLIFLTKLEKVLTEVKYKQYKKDFEPFLKDNGQQQPHMITPELLESNGWNQIIIDQKDIQNSTIWQYFCKSMITDIYTYIKLGLNIIHNTEKQEFNYIPHFETSYYDQDFEQLRNINAIVRIKIELEQQIQHHYLAMCNDWKNLPITNQSDTKNKNKSTLTVYKATRNSALTDFYKKTHDVHTLMGTRDKVNQGQNINSKDLLSSPQMVSPLKDYVFCYFLLYELYGQLTSFMTLDNLDKVISICSTSKLKPNIFPYTDEQYIPISELLATKSAAQGNHKNSIHPPITTYKKEDLLDYKQMLNPTRKPTDQYLEQKLSEHTTTNQSVQAQGFLSFFSNLGSDIVHAGKAAFSDIKKSAEQAWDATKDLGKSIGYGVAGLALEIGGQETEGSAFWNKSQTDLRKSATALSKSVDDFGSALESGIVAPIAEITGDLVGFILDDQKIGADFNTIIANVADTVIDLAENATKDLAVFAVAFYALPALVISSIIQLVVAAVYAAAGKKGAALDICHGILRSLVTVYLISLKVTKENLESIMTTMSVLMNSITTLFNDLIAEVCVIVMSGGTSLIYNLIDASEGKESSFNKMGDIVRNALNQGRQIENQVLGVAICVAVDVATGGAAVETNAAILESSTESALDSAIDEAQDAVEDAQKALEKAQKSIDDAKTPDEKIQAEENLNKAKNNLQKQKNILKISQDAKNQAIQDAQDLKYGKNIFEKIQKKAQSFFNACKNFAIKVTTKTEYLFNAIGNSLKELATNFSSQAADEASTVLENLSNESENVVAEIKPIAQDAQNALPPEASEKITQNITNLSEKVDDLSKAKNEFQAANAELKAAQNDPAEFMQAQAKLLKASRNVQQAASEVEKAQSLAENSLKDATKYEKDLANDPSKYISKNIDDSVAQAEENLAKAQSNLETAQAVGDSEYQQEAEAGLKQAKQELASARKVQELVQQSAKNITQSAEEQSMTLGEKFSNKFKDFQDSLRSQGRSLRDLFKFNKTAVEDAQVELNTAKEDLTQLNKQLIQDQKDLDAAKTALEKNPNDTDLQADEQRAQDQLERTKQNIKSGQKRIEIETKYVKEREAIGKESNWEKLKRYAGKVGDAISPIGTIMNIVFNITPVISSYNQDEKNLLQQKQQAAQVQDLWNANTQTKISTLYSNLQYLEEFYEKQKSSIGNQILGLSLIQNYNYQSISQFEQSILQSLAMIYTLQLYPDPITLLVPANTGSLWGLVCPYLNLYPSQSFYTTTIGRSDFPFAQEVAQAPELLTSTSKTKVKEWFNQRCTAIDKKDENNALKKPTDPLTVNINFKFLYTLESEFYVGIYMGKNFYDYFNASYIASLLGTTITNLTSSYGSFRNNPEKYAQSNQFNLNYINLNETYMAKMVVLYRTSSTDPVKLGVYEHNLTSKEWIFTQQLPTAAQPNGDHLYNLQATLNGDKLEVALMIDEQPQTKIVKTVTVMPLDNQRQYGIISSSAAIEWNQLTPKIAINMRTNVRKSDALLIPEINRGKQNKLLIQDAINQIFGGKQLTLISKQQALIFSQYIYASVQTDIAKITPKNPSDLLVFATNRNGKITNLGKAPNSFTDSKNNVLVSLITGHVFNNKWDCIKTVPQPWLSYSAPQSDYGPFLPSINKVITSQQQSIVQKLSKITFGSFDLDAADSTLILDGLYVYTCTQTVQGSSGQPFTDYLVFATKIPEDQTKLILGLPPTANNVACIISLVSGNVYTKETIIPKTGVPATSQASLNIYSINFIDYIGKLGALTNTIQNQQESYTPPSQTPPAIPPTTPETIPVAKKESLTKEGKTPAFTFHFSPRNFADRQKQAAAGVKFHFKLRPR
jgi:hypothetical protein